MKTILVLTDFSARAEHAAEYAMLIAAKANAKILLYNSYFLPQVIPAITYTSPYYEDASIIEKENLLQLARTVERLKKKFLEVHKINPPEIQIRNGAGNIADNLQKITKAIKFWMIVMGDKSKEGAFSRFVFGSDTHAVIDEAVCPVLLIPEKHHIKPIQKIALATDFQHSEHKPMTFLQELANIWKSEILVVHILSTDISAKEKTKNFDDYTKLIAKTTTQNISYIDVRADDIVTALEKFTKSKTVDILAILHKKRAFIDQILHKSISKELLEIHRVPLLVLT
jgi:nucleotide-binding universal stress UspA family protein